MNHAVTVNDSDAALVGRLLREAGAKAAAFAQHLHPHWLNAVWQITGLEPARHAAAIAPRRHGALLLSAYGLKWPGLDDFGRRAHRICVLGRRPTLQLLALRALLPRRDSVRRSVGREVRSALVEHLGEAAYARLLDTPRRGVSNGPALEAADLDLERLAVHGYRALCAQGAWQCRSALAITRLSLPPMPDTDACTASDDGAAPDESGEVIEHLQDYFPELAWLFGSDMDRALSASKMASCAPPTLLN